MATAERTSPVHGRAHSSSLHPVKTASPREREPRPGCHVATLSDQCCAGQPRTLLQTRAHALLQRRKLVLRRLASSTKEVADNAARLICARHETCRQTLLLQDLVSQSTLVPGGEARLHSAQQALGSLLSHMVLQYYKRMQTPAARRASGRALLRAASPVLLRSSDLKTLLNCSDLSASCAPSDLCLDLLFAEVGTLLSADQPEPGAPSVANTVCVHPRTLHIALHCAMQFGFTRARFVAHGMRTCEYGAILQHGIDLKHASASSLKGRGFYVSPDLYLAERTHGAERRSGDGPDTVLICILFTPRGAPAAWPKHIIDAYQIQYPDQNAHAYCVHDPRLLVPIGTTSAPRARGRLV